MRFAHLSLALSLLLLTGPAADAQTAVDPTGHWKGTIDIPNHPVDFEIDLGRNARGELVGTATTPGADHGTFPLLKITLDGERVMFYGRTDQPSQGALSTSGQAIAGTFTFSGYDLPFSLSRTGEAKILPPPTSPAVSKELAGTWKGTLSAAGQEFHVVMTISNQPDGNAVAQLVSADEGGLTHFLVVAQSGSSVTIQSRSVQASFAGALDAAGTELVGTWTQETTNLPLTFTRSVAEGRR